MSEPQVKYIRHEDMHKPQSPLFATYPMVEYYHYSDAMEENARLQAEVERLRKAGDMCDQLLACFEMEGRRGVNIGRDMWRAAKEGKPQ